MIKEIFGWLGRSKPILVVIFAWEVKASLFVVGRAI